jgi:hypothetical protein
VAQPTKLLATEVAPVVRRETAGQPDGGLFSPKKFEKLAGRQNSSLD